MIDFAGYNSSSLFQLAYGSMDVWNDVFVLPDVKGLTRLSTLKINKGAKPFSCTFEATEDAIEFIPREINVHVGKYELEVCPEAYRQTYLAQFQTKGVARTPEDMPFAKYVMESIFAEFGEELNDETAYLGVHNSAGTTAADITDGYGTILAAGITASAITPITTGAITSANAASKLTLLARAVPSKYLKPKWKLRMYMSYATYAAYTDNLLTMGYNTGRGIADIMNGTKWLAGYEGIIEIVPATWMGDSGRVFITPFENIILAADATEQDLANANIVQDVWSFKIGIAAALGFNFRYLGLIWTNEQV